MNADGSNAADITGTASVDEVYPLVSRDGSRICFTVVRMEKLPEGRTVPRFSIYWMNADGSNRPQVANDSVDPCWDSDGNRVAFVKRLSPEKTVDYQNAGLFVHDIHTHETEELTDGKLYHAYVPCWSPTGDWIVATVHEHAEYDHAIIVIDLRDKQIRSLERNGLSGCRPDLSWDGYSICWNPNDIQIGLTRFAPDCVDKFALRAIAQAPPPKGSVYFGDWSLDGRYIAYAMNPDVTFRDPKTRALWDIFVTRAEGGPSIQLTFDHANNKQPEFFSSI
jgi:Tol biopolymer transport system component